MHGVHSFTGQIKSVLQSSSHATTGNFFPTVVPPRDNWIFFLDLGWRKRLCQAGSAAEASTSAGWRGSDAGQVARQECGALGIEASTSAGWRGSAGQVARPGGFDARQVARPGASMPGRFAETLDSCRLRRQPRHFFSWEEFRPWRGLGRAPMPGRWRGRVAR